MVAGKLNRERLKFPKQHVHLKIVGRRLRYASFSTRNWQRYVAAAANLYRAANALKRSAVDVQVLNRRAGHTDPQDLVWKTEE